MHRYREIFRVAGDYCFNQLGAQSNGAHPRKVVHSIRHSVKQALRDVGCPKDVRDAIQGHSTGDVAETYGSGYGVSLMAEWLEKAVVRGL